MIQSLFSKTPSSTYLHKGQGGENWPHCKQGFLYRRSLKINGGPIWASKGIHYPKKIPNGAAVQYIYHLHSVSYQIINAWYLCITVFLNIFHIFMEQNYLEQCDLALGHNSVKEYQWGELLIRFRLILWGKNIIYLLRSCKTKIIKRKCSSCCCSSQNSSYRF